MAKNKANKNEIDDTIGITSPKSDLPEWYSEVILKSGMAEYAPISGCMVIRPYGYEIWERIREHFDSLIKKSGHRNMYFPLFIPDRFLKKETEHFSGFKPEVAYIDKKETDEKGKTEKYALRPTSETIIYHSYAKWIRSWRDLPLLFNQWCNIVRWETKATKLFLRTREFLWQEGHTVHESDEEASKEVMLIVGYYKKVMENLLAIPVLVGKKTENEKFAGALYTTTLESLMPDGKALQMGTSHNLGQNFAIAFGIKFRDRDETEKYAWQTSWGISTRLIGALVMTHGDDKGLVLPPRIAPIQAVIVPIIFEKNKKEVLREAMRIKRVIDKFRVEVDDRDDYSAGWKFNEWELKGVPLRIEIGPRDIRNKEVVLVRRDNGKKIHVKMRNLKSITEKTLNEIQNNLFRKAKSFLESNTKVASNFNEFKKLLADKKMIKANWCGESSCEDEIKDKTTATIRLIPFEKENLKGKCVHCGKKAKYVVYFAKAY